MDSDDRDNLEVEIAKALAVMEAGADIIADHSFFGDIDSFQKELIGRHGARLSIVGSYELAVRYRKRSQCVEGLAG